MLLSTLRIYGSAARDAGRAVARGGWALGWLVAALVGMAVLGVLVAPLGILGGFALGFAQAAAAGTYLACVRDTLGPGRPLDLGRVRDNLGAYTWDVMNVLFPLFLLDLVLAQVRLPYVGMVVGIAVFLFLNPLPEMVGRVRAGGLDVLGEAWSFMGRAGPEWLLPQVAFVAGAWALLPGGSGVDRLVRVLGVFGPRMGFMEAGSLGLAAWAGGGGLLRATALLVLVHAAMVFRAALYVRLASGSRRSRAWEARF